MYKNVGTEIVQHRKKGKGEAHVRPLLAPNLPSPLTLTVRVDNMN